MVRFLICGQEIVSNDISNLTQVFTSTVNVAFFGREVIGGTECEDQASSDYVDAYSRSKRAAEDLILSADNKASFA